MSRKQTTGLLISFAAAAPLLQQPSRASACGQVLFGRLDACALDELRGLDPPQRKAHLAAQGFQNGDWLPVFQQAANRYADLSPEQIKRETQLLVRVIQGTALAELLRERSTADTLKKLVETPAASESVIYAALVALSALGTEDAFVTSHMNHPDSRMARLATLAGGMHENDQFDARLAALRRSRADDSHISAALQFIDMYRHDRDQFERLAEVDEELRFVEHRLRRAFNPINGVTQTWDPLSGGHPVSRWAYEQWRQLAQAHPERTAEFIRQLSDESVPSPILAYRSFLTRLTGPAPAP